MTVGGIQLGLMYCFYYQSFLLLSVPEVLLFTVFTPIYVTLIYDLLKGRFSPWYLVTAIIAVAGAALIKFAGINENFLTWFPCRARSKPLLCYWSSRLQIHLGRSGCRPISAYDLWLFLPRRSVRRRRCVQLTR